MMSSLALVPGNCYNKRTETRAALHRVHNANGQRGTTVSTKKPKRELLALLPAWEMPSDPVKAVFWFLHWLLKVLVRYFWVIILGMVIYEVYSNWAISGVINGIVGGVVTLLVGGVVWALLWGVLLFLNVSTSISETIAQVSRMQQNLNARRPLYPFTNGEQESNVVEGTITDLDEERKKRRRE